MHAVLCRYSRHQVQVMSSSYSHRASESSESGLLDYTYENSQEDYTGIMARLHPPYVVEAEAVGVRERVGDPKRFVFQIDLKWSDDSCTPSYRSYTDFFDFQCDLLTEFPKEGGSQKGAERTIPYLPGKKMFQKSSRKLAESRLAQIDTYVKGLIAMSESISQSELTCRFFRSNWQEDKLRSGEGGAAVKYSVRQLSQARLLPGASSLNSPQEGITSSEEQGTVSGI